MVAIRLLFQYYRVGNAILCSAGNPQSKDHSTTLRTSLDTILLVINKAYQEPGSFKCSKVLPVAVFSSQYFLTLALSLGISF